MLVSSFPNYAWGSPMPFAGAPRDLYVHTCLQFFEKCICYGLVARLPFLCCVLLFLEECGLVLSLV